VVALLVVVGLALAGVAAFFALRKPFPSDRTPEGAYLRVAHSVSEGKLAAIFPYLETEAQWAAYTIRDARKKACDRARESYPAAERDALLAAWQPEADAPDGADVFALVAARRGWEPRLRKDLSGIAATQIDGDRATIVTVRGTRYPFHRRDNGIWGLTIFTADLLAAAERASRDLAVVSAAADDYDRGAHRTDAGGGGGGTATTTAAPAPR